MAVTRRSPLDLAVAAAVPLVVLLFAFGSSSVPELVRAGSKARWAMLFVLAALALARLAVRRPRVVAVPPAWVLAAALLVLGAESALWSVDARTTVGRIFTLGVLFVAAAALALDPDDRSAAASRVLDGVLAGAALVAVAGLVLLLVHHREAVQPATAGAGWRFRGIGQSPNTVPMLLAVGLPVAVWRAAVSAPRARALAVALVLLFAGEMAVSASRGALAAGFAGAVATALACGSRRARLVRAVALVALAAAALAVSRLPAPLASGSGAGVAPAAAAAAPAPAHRGIDANEVFPLEGEIGFPAAGFAAPVKRTLFGSSGRGQAWAGAWGQGVDRPVAGYGFGTEDAVFVDRFYAFEASFVENTYLGLFLQLGAVGTALFVALLAALAWSGVSAVRRVAGGTSPAAAALGVLLAAALVGCSQSGLLSVGNVAAASIWLCVLTLPAMASATGRPA